MTTIVRKAGQADVTALVAVAERFIMDTRDGGNRFKDIDFSHAKVYGLIIEALAHPDRYFLEVIEQDGEIIGGLLAQLSQYYFSDSTLAQDIVLFVAPGTRGARFVTRLVKNYVSWAEQHNAHEVILSTSTGIRTQGFANLAKRYGFAPSMNGYSRRL